MSREDSGGRSAHKTIKIDSTLRRVLAIAIGIAALLAAFWPLKWGLANMAAIRSDNKEITEYTAAVAPDDPQTHYAAAVLLEKSFAPGDIDKALREYEVAAALSPNNYLFWVGLGQARSRSGDAEGAEAAFRRALDLAPNYARVHWALGNLLVRQGRSQEGFEHIRTAVAADAMYTDAAAITAWQLFDGDLGQVHAALSDSPRLNAALASILAKENRFDEALAIWSKLPPAGRSGDLKETGKLLMNLLTAAKRYRDLSRVSGDVLGGPDTFLVGQISNGGFEEGLKTQDASVFEWQIAAGQQPQIALTNGQKRTGNNSLVLIFNSTESREFRGISQTVAVEPGKDYEFVVFYRSDLKSEGEIRWEIADAVSGRVFARTEKASDRSDWSPLRARFSVPATSDGVVVRLVRENCGIVCPISGNLWFDDASVNAIR
jgi:hypothetical protein